MPGLVATRSSSDLAGRYSNVGLVHSPDLYKPAEAFLDLTLGAAKYPDVFRGSLVIRVEADAIMLLRVDGERVVHQTRLRKDLDYRETLEGVKIVLFSEGPGGEGVISAKVTTTLLVSLADDGRIIIKAHEDIRAFGGILLPLPYRYTRDLWYEFGKNRG